MRLIHGDCIEAMREMGEASVDAIVTDPPYGLGFMGKKWDQPGALVERQADASQVWDHVGGNHNPSNSKDAARTRRSEGMKFQEWTEAWAVEALRVLKPGGHLLAFGGTRTYHRLACAIEDAGFEIRDTLAWLYGSGFPKSHNLKGEWDGWGTALKPAHEPVVMARKPLVGTVAANVLAHGTGAINVDGCRIEGRERTEYGLANAKRSQGNTYGDTEGNAADFDASLGRWPANVLLDEEAAAMLDGQTGDLHCAGSRSHRPDRSPFASGESGLEGDRSPFLAESGGASRFFYVAKASRRERNAGLDGFAEGRARRHSEQAQGPKAQQTPRAPVIERNVHPTVKPIALMRYLCRLVTPPGGTILDPFLGSGTTGCAAALEGFDFIGIEREADYLTIAEARIKHWAAQSVPLTLDAA